MITISTGELLDKYSILVIKEERITDADKLVNITKELDYIGEVVLSTVDDEESIWKYWDELYQVNMQLWDVEDKLRQHEANGDFGDEFVELARSVYRLNDRRAELKKLINVETNSPFIEEKSYA